MDNLKWWCGLGPQPAAASAVKSGVHPIVARNAAQQQSARELLQEQISAQRLNVEVEQEQQQLARLEAVKCKERGLKEKWLYWKRDEAEAKERETVWQGKLSFSEDQLRIHESASSNLQQALILKDGKRELDATMTAMNSLDLHDTIDEMRDHAQVVAQHDAVFSERLSEPSTTQRQAALDWDDEWDAEQSRAVADRLPTAGTGGIATAAAAATPSKPVEEK
jgi:hypothetical protein